MLVGLEVIAAMPPSTTGLKHNSNLGLLPFHSSERKELEHQTHDSKMHKEWKSAHCTNLGILS
eukprot:c36210_g1_i1 orf=50-238(+)